MRKQLLAGAAVLTLAVGLTTSAMAFEHKAGRGNHHVARVHAGGTHGFRARQASRFAPSGGWEAGNAYDYSGPKSLGPLGFTFGCVHGYCGQGYSVPAWTY